MAFSEKSIAVAVKLAANTETNQPKRFDESGTDVVTFSGSRISARIQNSGAPAGSQAQVAVWGLTPSLMNQLSTLGMVIQMIQGNTITVTAGERGGAMSTVFVGTIMQAYADFNAMPDVPMRFECQAGGVEQVINYEASSYTDATDVAKILERIAGKIGWGFENSGVTAQLSNPYLSGSPMEQVRRVAEAVRINAEVINNVLCVWPRYGHRSSVGGVPLVAPPPIGQMIGYPTYTQQGIMLRTVFDPRIKFGGQVQVQSVLPMATGLWDVQKLDHALDALVPKGSWESTIFAYNPTYPAPLPPRT